MLGLCGGPSGPVPQSGNSPIAVEFSADGAAGKAFPSVFSHSTGADEGRSLGGKEVSNEDVGLGFVILGREIRPEPGEGRSYMIGVNEG